MTNQLIDPQCSALLLIDLQEQLLPKIDNAQNVVAAANWLAGVASDLGVPIFFTEQYPERLGSTVDPVAQWIDSARCYTKMSFGWMREPEAAAAGLPRQVVIAGTEAHVCVLQTALGLAAVGHEVYAVADALGSRRPQDRELAMARMRAAGVVVVGAEMVAFEWLQRAGTETFRRVLPRLRAGWEVGGDHDG
ncbi:hydrolase [Halorhodospira abdelmalekii]|uniref:isochorismatase family protein n=1 Tax=Halorhodospira abdelmalekii TaxID=421629 RepID=UPI001906B7DB|nr:isochorismatase family protein [Halorhodospira abdelmalekii]MBK1734667.1 hydrolase [Halorhodospira abdelmalekii]